MQRCCVEAIEVISDTHAALEQCGDLFRADPVGSNMVTAALSPAVEFELLRVSDAGTTTGAALRVGRTCALSEMAFSAALCVANQLPVDGPLQISGPAGAVATVAGRWSERCDGIVVAPELFRMYRLGELHEPSKRRKGRAFVSERDRLDQAAEWSYAFGNETGLVRTLDESVAQMEQAINEKRLIEYRVKGEVVSQLVISAVRFGVVRIGLVYTPHGARGRGHASAFTAAVSAQQAERQKVDQVVLNTQSSNAATNRLYRRIGFVAAFEMLSVRLEPGPLPAA
jgi:RimJ/RimL family protein N-acetyltransferase|tara:strand:+ start:1178 stop:2029 length:852 start_codon:yes stop_codon:yes gene_type:complete